MHARTRYGLLVAAAAAAGNVAATWVRMSSNSDTAPCSTATNAGARVTTQGCGVSCG